MPTVLLFLAALTALSDDPARGVPREAWNIGQSATISAEAIGCLKVDTMAGAVKMLHEQNQEAFLHLIVPPLRAGECVSYPIETQGTLTAMSVSQGLSKVRPHGDPNEYWFPREMVTQ